MKCSKCGAHIDTGQVYCPSCGAEVQLVPDFYSSTSVTNTQKQKEQKQKDRLEQERRKKAEEAARKKKIQDRRRRKKILISILLVVIMGAAIWAVKSYLDQVNNNSFDYQMEKAEVAYTNHSVSDALKYVNRAIELDTTAIDARILRAKIFVQNSDDTKAIAEYESIVALDPENEEAYGDLIKLYTTEGNPDKIKELLDGCNSDKIRAKYLAYICSPPSFSIDGGSYTTEQTLTLSSANPDDVIYYSLDGQDPDRLSKKYTQGIKLSEGTTTVKAIAINVNGIKSDVTSATYTITLPAPTAPVVSPAAGTYTAESKDTDITVVVPTGCTAYYAIDKEETPTKDDTLYTEPVEMPAGEHTFSVILIDQHGKTSPPSRVTYTMEDTDS